MAELQRAEEGGSKEEGGRKGGRDEKVDDDAVCGT